MVWAMTADGRRGPITFARDMPLHWVLRGVGDVTGDGRADLVWRNTTNGATMVWAMTADGRRGHNTFPGGMPRALGHSGCGGCDWRWPRRSGVAQHDEWGDDGVADDGGGVAWSDHLSRGAAVELGPSWGGGCHWRWPGGYGVAEYRSFQKWSNICVADDRRCPAWPRDLCRGRARALGYPGGGGTSMAMVGRIWCGTIRGLGARWSFK